MHAAAAVCDNENALKNISRLAEWTWQMVQARNVKCEKWSGLAQFVQAEF